uniref:Uncharacterized protein n=1 Tax=Cannabis sativa TaxID=3483 RepID=A0A803QRT3_CANSA
GVVDHQRLSSGVLDPLTWALLRKLHEGPKPSPSPDHLRPGMSGHEDLAASILTQAGASMGAILSDWGPSQVAPQEAFTPLPSPSLKVSWLLTETIDSGWPGRCLKGERRGK